MRSVYIVENPLLDYVIHEDKAWLERFGAEPGSMRTVDHERFLEVTDTPRGYRVLPGGSGANTARALALLYGSEPGAGPRVAYSGGIGADEPGDAFRCVLEELGIETGLAVKAGNTGVSAIVVTPDHERTMFTCLGASRDYRAEDLRLDILRDSRLFYSTGYLWDSGPQELALKAAVDEARAGGVQIAFDLADAFVVESHFRELRDWLRGRVDLLFGNREELALITDCSGSDAEIIRRAERFAPVVAMKIGKGGCLVLGGGRLVHVPGERVTRVDATAAGDSFSAGFLYGYIEGRELIDCGRLGNRLASRIITVEGARYELLDRAELLL